jgi:hypothetical protein
MRANFLVSLRNLLRGKTNGDELEMNDFHNEMDLILAKNNLPNDSHGIKQAIETTANELREAVTNGDGQRLVELDARMRVLSARAFGADVSDTKKAIDKAELEKISIAKEIETLREIKKQKNFAAGRAQELFQKRLEKVNRAEFQLQLAQNKLTSARVASRETKARLQKLLDEKQKETSRQYKNYELSKY